MHQLNRYALFVVIKANKNGFEMIMNYIFKQINKLIKYKIEKKTRYGDEVRTRNLYDSGQAIHQPLHPLCYGFFFRLACAYNILDVIKRIYYSKKV